MPYIIRRAGLFISSKTVSTHALRSAARRRRQPARGGDARAILVRAWSGLQGTRPNHSNRQSCLRVVGRLIWTSNRFFRDSFAPTFLKIDLKQGSKTSFSSALSCQWLGFTTIQ